MMAEYNDLIEGPLDYSDPYCIDIYEFKLNAEGNYVLEPVEERKTYSRFTGDIFEEDEFTRVAPLENEFKSVINSNPKTFLYFFHKLPSLFYKKKRNKFFLLKKVSYSRKLKNKVFKYLMNENNTHPIFFIKNVLSNYKVSFDGLEEEYLYTSFDNLRNLKFSGRETLFFLSIEGFFDEYKLNTSASIDDKEEIINSSDSVSSEEKDVYTLTSKLNASLKELNKHKKMSVASMPYNFNNVSINDGRISKNIKDDIDDAKINAYLKNNSKLIESVMQSSGPIGTLKNEETIDSVLISSLNTTCVNTLIEKNNKSTTIGSAEANKTFDDLLIESKENQANNSVSMLSNKNILTPDLITEENKETTSLASLEKSCTKSEELNTSAETISSNNTFVNNETKIINEPIIKEAQKSTIPKAQFNEHFIYKLDLINED